MLQFAARRLFFIAAVCLFIVFAVNLGMGMASNSEVREPSFDLVVHSRAAWAATEDFFSGIVRGDWGTVEVDGRVVPVSELVGDAYANSMLLLLIALTAAALVGLYFGSAAALSKRPSVSLTFLTLTTVGISIPSFFLALLLQQFLIRYQMAYGRRLLSVAGFGWDLDHMLLPVLVLAARPLAYITRSAFVSLGGVLQADFIRTAYAKGLSRRRAVWVHALKNTAVPVLTAVGVSLRFSLSTLPIVEYFFAWPGVGYLLIEAINGRQTDLVVALAFVLGLTFLLVNFLLDVIYRVVDPRLRDTQ